MFGKNAKKLLIIDDDQGYLDLMKGIFSGSEIEITCVDKEIDAISAMKKKHSNVVLLDYQLPLVNGDQLISALQDVNPKAKFIVITGLLGEEIEEKFKGSGYFAFFEKAHIDIAKLRSKVMDAFNY